MNPIIICACLPFVFMSGYWLSQWRSRPKSKWKKVKMPKGFVGFIDMPLHCEPGVLRDEPKTPYRDSAKCVSFENHGHE